MPKDKEKGAFKKLSSKMVISLNSYVRIVYYETVFTNNDHEANGKVQ